MSSGSDPAEADDYEDDEEFQDALEEVQEQTDDMPLERAFQDAQAAVELFFNNRFMEARNMMLPWCGRSMYHTMGSAVFDFLEAMLTYEQPKIAKASESLKKSLLLCNRYRKKNTIGQSIGKMVKRPNYQHYTDTEIHAELCYAESLLLKAILTFIEDETLSSFIKGAMKIRSCYNSYKECNSILNSRTWSDNAVKVHFESGVRIGVGTFNLMISMLPARVIKILEFIGFSGNKESGLRDLNAGYALNDGLRHVLSVLTLLAYNLIIVYIISHQDGNLKACTQILDAECKKYPNGVWFLFFRARLEFLKGNVEESIDWYTKSWQSQSVWPQFHHMCFWDMLWIRCTQGQYREALKYASMLLENSQWSRTFYSYLKAILYLAIEDELMPSEKDELVCLMTKLPKYKQRIAGKSLPMEKFAIKRSARFLAQEKLVLPAMEMMYLWNYFKVFRKNFDLADTALRQIDRALEEVNSDTLCRYDADDRALVLLLKGSCLRQLSKPNMAKDCLEAIFDLAKSISEDTFIVPFAMVEMAYILIESGDTSQAVLLLENARKQYTGYSMESRLHFRIHTAVSELTSKK